MKLVGEGDAFRLEMEASDAGEAAIEQALQDIGCMLDAIRNHGHTPDIRRRDRGGYWRYAEVERSLELIRTAADTALRHIKFLDFPEDPLPDSSQTRN